MMLPGIVALSVVWCHNGGEDIFVVNRNSILSTSCNNQCIRSKRDKNDLKRLSMYICIYHHIAHLQLACLRNV